MLRRILPGLLILLVVLATGQRLSADPKKPDPKTPDPNAPAGADLPEAVVKFQKSMETMRDVEALRIETRIAVIEKYFHKANPGKGANIPAGLLDGIGQQVAARHVPARDALALEKNLRNRLKLVKSDKPFIPRLSPKDFAVGQIGEFDDDFALATASPGKEEATISVGFDDLRYLGGTATQAVSSWTLRPDIFRVRSPIVAPLEETEKGRDHKSAANRLLRKYVFEIVERVPRGLEWEYVLVPFEMDEVRGWMRDEAKRAKKK